MAKVNFRIAPLCFLAALSTLARPSWGWIACGHQISALVAWDDLTPKTKAACTALLKQHVRYKEDLLDTLAKDTPPSQIARFVFARAATWPDMVRLQTNPMHTLYSHPSWHFIDLPIVENNVPVPLNPYDRGVWPHNLVQAIAKNEADVMNAKLSPGDRAVALCWIEHLIGDIHQPLHCSSLYSSEFPDGDRGGNSEMVLRDPPYPDSAMNLHFMWDSMAGEYLDGTTDAYIAEGVRADPKFSRAKFKAELAITDPMGWAKEGRALAVKYVYLNGQLHGVKRHHRGTKIPGVPPGYINRSETLAMRQMALAGYRLADTLNGIFDPRQRQ